MRVSSGSSDTVSTSYRRVVGKAEGVGATPGNQGAGLPTTPKSACSHQDPERGRADGGRLAGYQCTADACAALPGAIGQAATSAAP
jgi:hypothetical protein